jgi:hypothetical protein
MVLAVMGDGGDVAGGRIVTDSTGPPQSGVVAPDYPGNAVRTDPLPRADGVPDAATEPISAKPPRRERRWGRWHR